VFRRMHVLAGRSIVEDKRDRCMAAGNRQGSCGEKIGGATRRTLSLYREEGPAESLPVFYG
jgi:hypothetical protein